MLVQMCMLLTSAGHGNVMISPLSSVLSSSLVDCSWKTNESVSSWLRRCNNDYVCVGIRERLPRLRQASPGSSTAAPSVYQFHGTQRASYPAQRTPTTTYCTLDREDTTSAPLCIFYCHKHTWNIILSEDKSWRRSLYITSGSLHDWRSVVEN